MSDIRQTRNTGILRDGWTGSVEDYALSCNWSQDGNVLMACDVMGGIKAFHGKSGEIFGNAAIRMIAVFLQHQLILKGHCLQLQAKMEIS